MSNEKYRKYIAEMLEKIEDDRALKLIYEITTQFFIKREV